MSGESKQTNVTTELLERKNTWSVSTSRLLSSIHHSAFYLALYLALPLALRGNSAHLTWVRLQQPQEQRYLFLTVHAVFSCVQTKVWRPMIRILNMRTDVNACDCTWGLYGHRKRVCTGSWLSEINPLPHRGIEPVSAARRSDAIPTEPPLFSCCFINVDFFSRLSKSPLFACLFACLWFSVIHP